MDDDGPFEKVVDQLRKLINDAADAKLERQVALTNAASRLAIADVTELILGARAIRTRHFGQHIFGEPAWDILLGLHLAHHRGEAVDEDQAASLGGTPVTTGSRWLAILVREGLVLRTPVSFDERQRCVSLTETGVAALDHYVETFSDWVSTKATLSKL